MNFLKVHINHILQYYTYLFLAFYYENVKHTEKLKEEDGELLYNQHPDSTIDILLYLLYHISTHLYLLYFNAFQSKSYT